MVLVQVTRGEGYFLEVTGHAGGTHGSDIVCAAISSLVQNALVGLETLNGLEWNYKLSDGTVLIHVKNRWNDKIDKALFLLETTVSSLKEIASTHSDKLVIREGRSDDIV